MDEDYATDADLALSRKRGVERLIDGTKLQDVVVSSIDGRDSPTKRVCLRQMENAIKPDTPAIPSIRSRLVVLDRQLSGPANDENSDETPQPSMNTAAKTAAQEVRLPRKDSAASRITEFASENWEEVEVPNLRRIKKPIDPALQPVSERMAGWQKKVDATSAEKGSLLSDRRKTAWEGKACGPEEKNMVRSRLSMWEQKVSEEQERAATPVVAPRGLQVERVAGTHDGLEGKAEMDVGSARNIERGVSREVAAAGPRMPPSAVAPLVTPPTPAARTSIYQLIKKPSSATSLVPSAPTPSARPAPIVALAALSECKDGETLEKMALDVTGPSADAKMLEPSTTSEENRIVTKCFETDILDRREGSSTEEAPSNVAEIKTSGNTEPDVESIHSSEKIASEEMTCPISAAHDVAHDVLSCRDHSPVSENHHADSTETISSQVPRSFSPRSTTAFETSCATPNPGAVDSETESCSTPLPFNVSLLRRPRDARETPSARQIKQAAPRPFSYDSVLEDREEEEESLLYNKRATYAADISRSVDRYERSQSVDDCLNRFNVTVPIELGSIVRQNDPNRREGIGPGEEIALRKSTVEQLKVFQEAVIREQNIILQTSNALSKCCHSNSAFAGSVEAVECHRLLLISTKKKETYQRTIHTLKVGGSPKGSTNDVTGKFTVSNISMPFKQEFISKLTVGEPSVVHHFIAMIRCGKTVHFSPVVSTQDAIRGFLDISGPFHFDDIDQNFELEIEVYGMSVARDVGTPKKKRLLTPKKKLLRGAKSPGGGGHAELSVPSFFRASNFQLMGLITITMPMVNRNQFSLEKVAQSSPLQGTINLKMVCLMETNIVERGFLTMFEDVNGFGAWHRRWSLLKDNVVSYWKYPDDEKSKEPIGSIDLKMCSSDGIGPIPRDICARPNTFELVTARRQKQGETDTLVSKCFNTITTTKHWLSADTKEERIAWCEKLNEVVQNLRLWHPDFISGGRSSSSSSSQNSQI